MDDKDRYRAREIEDEAISLINEEPVFRNREGCTVLRRWPKQPPLRAVLTDALAHVEVLLSRLESGVYCPRDVRAHYETTIRQLYL